MIEIQPLSRNAAPFLARMHAECFGDARWSEEQIRGSLILETTQAWLATANSEPAGFLLCQKTGDETEILTFGVLPAYRRQGTGEALLRHAVSSLPEGGVMHLEVAADNGPARRLYEKCGFVHASTRKGYYRRESGLVDAVCYRYETAKKPANLHL